MANNGLESSLEQTLLKPGCTQAEIEEMCTKAAQTKMHGVCVPPFFVPAAKKALENSDLEIITVVGFPFGYNNINTKAEETKKAISDGATEIDMVMNISAFKSGMINHVADGIDSIKTLCGMNDLPLKVIIESGILTQKEIILAAEICADKEVDFVKTSTGFIGHGATIETVSLLRNILPKTIKIKASGGIKDAQTAQAMLAAGADRIGTSAGFTILEL
ncbi:MAG: deoxyribose-phosphate aldolase [Bacteroidetes bacterium]|nr:deoxyribose-phosphate aldolase [Bacteroidota bacterium]